ncbi:MAG: hypothetical protein RL757_1301 [Bacteroidota bacterium]|jgi:hypothetical protein
MSNNQENLTFRPYESNDYPALKTMMQAAFGDMGSPYYSESEIGLMSKLYPKGQILAFWGDQLVGATTSRIVPYQKYAQPHTATDCGNVNLFIEEAAIGDSLNGMDVFINPNFKTVNLGTQLVKKLLEIIEQDNLRALLGVSRLVRYHKVASEMDCETYVKKVCDGELIDPVLNFHLRYGSTVLCVAPNFFPEDTKSGGHAAIITWASPCFDAGKAICPSRTNMSEKLLQFSIAEKVYSHSA